MPPKWRRGTSVPSTVPKATWGGRVCSLHLIWLYRSPEEGEKGKGKLESHKTHGTPDLPPTSRRDTRRVKSLPVAAHAQARHSQLGNNLHGFFFGFFLVVWPVGFLRGWKHFACREIKKEDDNKMFRCSLALHPQQLAACQDCSISCRIWTLLFGLHNTTINRGSSDWCVEAVGSISTETTYLLERGS